MLRRLLPPALLTALSLAAGCQSLADPCVCPAPVSFGAVPPAAPPLAPHAVPLAAGGQVALQPRAVTRHRLGLGLWEFSVPVPYPELRAVTVQEAPQVVTLAPLAAAPQPVCVCPPSATISGVVPFGPPPPPPVTGQTMPPPLAPAVSQPRAQGALTPAQVQDLCNILNAAQKAAGCGEAK